MAVEKLEFIDKLYNQFDQRYEELENDLMNQASMMGMIYQLYTYIQIDSFGMFNQLNNRFEYENHWRFDMKV